jgi:hypothetical protein
MPREGDDCSGPPRDRPTTVRDVVRDIVAETAPDELVLIAALDRVDDSRAVRLLSDRKRSREPLGFGLDQAVAMVTPIVWIALNEAVKQSTEKAVDGVTDRLRRAVWRSLRRNRTRSQTVGALTRDQLGVVHRMVAERATEAGLGHERAAVLADRVVARLLLALPAQSPPDTRDR